MPYERLVTMIRSHSLSGVPNALMGDVFIILEKNILMETDIEIKTNVSRSCGCRM